MKKIKALIVVDVQNDFCPGGTLPVPEGDTIVPKINELLPKFDLVIFTKDWHPTDHICFASRYPGKKPFETVMIGPGAEMLWPDHCVQNTPGAELHPDIDLSKCKKDFYFFKKGMEDSEGYSGFENTGLKEFLDERDITETYVCGLAGDYCCKETAIDSAMAGYDTYFIIDAIKFIGDKEKTFELLKEANVNIVESWVLPLI
jgi:nicotinamidase/pyrazinamidase